MKKISFIFLLFLLLSLSSCSKNNDFLSNDELERFGLSNLSTPTHATNYYNKSTNTMLTCYMSVGNDNDVRNYVLDILKMLEDENVYKLYGYTKNDDMYKEHRNIYLSSNIDDYLVDSYDYSTDPVSYNSYIIYYVLNDVENKIFELNITSYTEEQNHLYLSEYNLYFSVVKRNASNYTIITE